MSPRVAVAPPRTAAGGAGLVLLGAFCVQWAASMAVPAFGAIGPAATSAWRFLFGAVVLTVLVRPRFRSWGRREWIGSGALGVATALMNLSFYQAINRIHLGTAVAIEYLGPFLLAAFGKRSWRHLIFVVLAILGVLALTRPSSSMNWQGAVFAVGAGAGWAAYTFASHRVGAATEGFEGLATAMIISAACTAAFLVPSFHHVVETPSLAGRLLAMAVLATVVGFGAEMLALRRLRPSVVGVLLALNPAVAFLVGWLFLSQTVTWWDAVGMSLVIVAGIGVTRDAGENVEAIVL